jgi:hypothetical protein
MGSTVAARFDGGSMVDFRSNEAFCIRRGQAARFDGGSIVDFGIGDGSEAHQEKEHQHTLSHGTVLHPERLGDPRHCGSVLGLWMSLYAAPCRGVASCKPPLRNPEEGSMTKPRVSAQRATLGTSPSSPSPQGAVYKPQSNGADRTVPGTFQVAWQLFPLRLKIWLVQPASAWELGVQSLGI